MSGWNIICITHLKSNTISSLYKIYYVSQRKHETSGYTIAGDLAVFPTEGTAREMESIRERILIITFIDD